MALDDIPEFGFWCDHSDPSRITEVSIPEDKGHVTHYKCTICDSTFPVIGDTDMWIPALVIYETPYG